jgi:predicted Zn-dependent peptidase
MDVQQARLVMGFRTLCTLNNPSYPALVVANALLGGGAASRLFATFREQLSLCYAIHSTVDKYKGILLIHAGVAGDKLEQTEEEILHQLLLLQQGEFTDEELRSAVQYTASQQRRLGDSQLMRSEYWLGQTMAELRMTPEELAKHLENVTREQVIQALKRLAIDSVYTLRPETIEEVSQA